MASSLSTKPFLGVSSSSDGSSRLGSLQSQSNLLSPSLHIPCRRSHPMRLEIQAAGNTFGSHFRVTTYGESHGGGVGCIIDGCPPRLPLSETDMQILAYVSQVHNIVLPENLVDHENLTLDQIESNIVRCPNSEYAEKMIGAIDAGRVRGDSVGGVVTCIVQNVPRGLGSPIFDKLEAELAKAVMSLPATKGFEFGSGFAGTFLTGSEHNDEFYMDEHGHIRTRTNRSGGDWVEYQNGEMINMRIAFKPTSTIARKQNTVTRDRHETELIARGRHDPCVVPRAVPMVEAMVALVLVDQLVAHHSQCMLFPIEPALQEPLEMVRTDALQIPH